MGVQIKGANELANQFKNIRNKTTAQAEGVVRKWTEFVRGEAIELCPVDTGELQQSIHSAVETNGDDIDGVVFTNKEYGPYVEFGTTKQASQPFMFPALNNNEDRVLKGMQSDFKKLFKG